MTPLKKGKNVVAFLWKWEDIRNPNVMLRYVLKYIFPLACLGILLTLLFWHDVLSVDFSSGLFFLALCGWALSIILFFQCLLLRRKRKKSASVNQITDSASDKEEKAIELLMSAPDSVLIRRGPELGLAFINDKALRQTGLTRADIIGNNIDGTLKKMKMKVPHFGSVYHYRLNEYLKFQHKLKLKYG